MAPRPRLLLLITLAEIGGAQTYVSLLVPALTSGFDVTVAAWGPGPLRAAVEEAGATYVPLRHVRRALSPWRDLLGLLELYRLCRRIRPQIVHANSSKAGVLGRTAAWLARVPVRMFTVHGWAFAAYDGRAARGYLWADRLMRPITTEIVCVADNELRRGVEAGTCTPARTTVIPNAVDVSRAPQAMLDGEPPLVVSVGRLAYPKDFGTFVRSLGRLEPGSFTAALAGDGPGRGELEAELDGTGLADTVRLLGHVADVPALLASADVFVLSSLSEGMPISILEAMAAGLPVVATAVGGVPELVIDGETGLLVPPGDAEALEAAIRKVVEDGDLRRRMGAAGRRRALDRFDLPAFRAAHVELYHRLLTPASR